MKKQEKGVIAMSTLMNGVEQNKKHPETFEIPTKEEKNSVETGAWVKLCFEEEEKHSERMWVKVTSRNNDNFEGILDNDPYNLTTIKCGDVVKFVADNILNIY